MKNAVHLYVTPDGREYVIPPALAAKTKFTKDGMPDRRLKSNSEFIAWADAADKGVGECKECGRKEGEGHYDDCPVGLGVGAQWVTTELKSDGPTVRETVHLNPETHTAQQSAQAYAQRVWDGQSVDVPRAEKLRRVKLALDGQGLSMEGVVL